MRRLLIAMLLITLGLIGSAQSTIEFTLTQAGTLSEMLPEDNDYVAPGIKVVGPMDIDDLIALKVWCNPCVNFSLDLSEAIIEEIPENMFYSSHLTRIILPETLKYIRRYAFKSSRLFFVDFSCCKNLISIGYGAFRSCNHLTYIDLSQCLSLKDIGLDAFCNSTYISQLILPENLEEFSTAPFEETNITFIEIPPSVKKITVAEERYKPRLKLSSKDVPELEGSCSFYVPKEFQSNYESKWGFSVRGYDPTKISNYKIDYNEGGILMYKGSVYQSGQNIEVIEDDGTYLEMLVIGKPGYHIETLSRLLLLMNNLISFSGNFYKEGTLVFAKKDPVYLKVNCTEGGIVKIYDKDIATGTSLEVNTAKRVRIYIKPDEGYYIEKVLKNNLVRTGYVEDDYLTEIIDSNTELTVSFKKKSYQIQVYDNSNYKGGGTVKINNSLVESGKSLSVESLTDVKVEITPSHAYDYVKQIKVNGEDVTKQLENNILLLPSISSDKKIEVVFEKKTNKIKVVYSEGGRVIIDNSVIRSGQSWSYYSFTDIKIRIDPNGNYFIQQVKIGDVDVTHQISNGILTIPSISEDKEITVIFGIDTSIDYAVKAIYNDGGKIKINDQLVTSGNSISVNALSDVKVTIIPDKGYHLKSMKLEGTNVTNQIQDNVFTIPAVSVNKEITVTFEKDLYAVKVTYSAGGTVSLNDRSVTSGSSTSVDALTDVKISIIPNAGYHLKQVKIGTEDDVTDQVNNNVLTIPSILENKEVAVAFEKNAATSFTFRVNASEGGIVKVDDRRVGNESSMTVPVTGTKLEFLPDNQYRIAKVLLGSKDITDEIVDNVYNVTSVSSDLSLSVTFERYLFNAFILMEGDGRIQIGDKTVSVGGNMGSRKEWWVSDLKAGSLVDIIFIHDDYYEIKKATLDEEDITLQAREGRYQIQSLESGLNLFVEYQRKSYKLTLEAFRGVELTVKYTKYKESTQIELESGNVPVEIYSNNLYYIKQVLLSGKKVFDGDGKEATVARFSIDMNADKKLKIISVLRDSRQVVLNVKEPGTLGNLLSDDEKKYVTDLFVYGVIDQRDFAVMNQMESLKYLEIGRSDFDVAIVANSDFPANTIPEKVFQGNKTLERVEVYSESVESIGNSAFANCAALSSCSGNIRKMGEEVFKNCKMLSVFGFSSVEEFGKGIFEGCSALEYIHSLYVEKIPADAFNGCTLLKNIYLYKDHLETIGENAFKGCTSLKVLWVESENLPEVYSNTFDDLNYDLTELIINNSKSDNYYLYKHHSIWGKFKNIYDRGNTSYKKVTASFSYGGLVWVGWEDSDKMLLGGCSFPVFSRVEFFIEPNEGYSIESVFLSGKDITRMLDEENKYVIPELENDVVLEVKFKKESDSTSIEQVENANKRVYRSAPRRLVLSGFEAGVPVYVYDGSGRLVVLKTIRDSVEVVDVPSDGLYFVRIGKESFKVIL